MKNSSRVGDLAEFYALTWLWDNGYEVFMNPGSTGPVDMVAIKDGRILLLDIKSKGSLGRSGFSRTEKQMQLGVQILVFNPRVRKIRLVKHRGHK